jgi:hypothetical protein
MTTTTRTKVRYATATGPYVLHVLDPETMLATMCGKKQLVRDYAGKPKTPDTMCNRCGKLLARLRVREAASRAGAR